MGRLRRLVEDVLRERLHIVGSVTPIGVLSWLGGILLLFSREDNLNQLNPDQPENAEAPFATLAEPPDQYEKPGELVAVGWIGLVLSMLGIAGVFIYLLPALTKVPSLSNLPIYKELANNRHALMVFVFSCAVGIALGVLLLYGSFRATNGSRKCRIPLNIYAICNIVFQGLAVLQTARLLSTGNHPASVLPFIFSILGILFAGLILITVNRTYFIEDRKSVV